MFPMRAPIRGTAWSASAAWFVTPTLGPAPLVLGRIDLLGPSEEVPDLLLQADHLRLDPAVAHSLVRGGVRLDLGPVEGHDPELDEPGLLTPPDDLEEEALEGGKVPLAEVADGPEVRGAVRGGNAEGDIFLTALGDPPGRRDPDRVGVQQELDHHPGVVRRIPPGLLLVDGGDRGEVQLIHHVREEVDEATCR